MLHKLKRNIKLHEKLGISINLLVLAEQEEERKNRDTKKKVKMKLLLLCVTLVVLYVHDVSAGGLMDMAGTMGMQVM